MAFTANGLEVTTYRTAPPSIRSGYETFVRGLTLEDDNEPGDAPNGTWAWVKENDATFVDSRPYGSFIFLRPIEDIVATASLVPDDRGVAAKLGLDQSPEYLGIFGFFLARKDLRRQGLGRVITEFMDNHVTRLVRKLGEPKDVYLFTSVPYAAKMYREVGFVRVDGQAVNLPEFGFDEELYVKHYQP